MKLMEDSLLEEKCPGCGEKITKTTKKCPSCGLNLVKTEENICPDCGREIDDVKNGCLYCKSKEEYLTRKNSKAQNTIASILQILAWGVLLVGIFFGTIMSGEPNFLILIASFLSFVFVYALGEIIQILHDIRAKLYSK